MKSDFGVGMMLGAGALALAVALPLAAQSPDSAAAKKPARATALDEVVVTATRTAQAIRLVPANVTLVSRLTVAHSTAQTVPDLLWRIPGFSTRDYQASSSSNAVRSVSSFRGLNGSSAGRTLVLLDGIPAAEPFGGWMNWARMPLPLLERAEVVRGGGSMAWGSRALGGVINLISAEPRGSRLDLNVEGGSLGTIHTAGSGSWRQGALSASAAGDFFDTDGFIVLPENQRGPIDHPYGKTSRVLYGRAGYDLNPNVRAYVSGNYLYENSTGSTAASPGSISRFAEARGGVRWVTQTGAVLTVSAFGNHRNYRNDLYSVSRDRTSAVPSRQQTIPANSLGTTVQWSQMLGARHQMTAGTDLAWVDGTLTEAYNYVASAGRLTQERVVGGHQITGGLFVQDAVPLGDRWRLLAGLRGDWARNTSGSRVVNDLLTGNQLSDTAYTPKSQVQLNWSLGVRHELSPVLAWRASGYTAFRLPTMYEMYQPNFSSRGAVTEANPSLKPERLIGAELGGDVTLGTGLVSRVTFFWNQVNDPVVDYTVGTAGSTAQNIPPCGVTPAGQTCRQRRNVPHLRTRGIEAELEYHPLSRLTVSGSYGFNPTVIIAPGQAIDGHVARGAARHIASAFVSWDAPRLASLTLEGRYVGSRSDDDLDTIRLGEFFVAGVRVGRALWRGAEASVRIENLFDRIYPIAQSSSGQIEIGAPRRITFGLRAGW